VRYMHSPTVDDDRNVSEARVYSLAGQQTVAASVADGQIPWRLRSMDCINAAIATTSNKHRLAPLPRDNLNGRSAVPDLQVRPRVAMKRHGAPAAVPQPLTKPVAIASQTSKANGQGPPALALIPRYPEDKRPCAGINEDQQIAGWR
jgi:hypothetical protein